ncbi:MAG: FtsW/RodA/SpoVE family cell cycle protein [Phycisphaerae bacterium]
MNEGLRRYFRYTSWPILLATVALIGIGLAALHAAERADPELSGIAARQAIYATAGIIVMIAATIVPYRRLGGVAYLFFAVTLVLLVVVLLLPPVSGARRWIDLKVFRVQPSELAKLALIVMLAWYLRQGDHYRRLRGLIVPFVLTFIPMGLILVEPDLGTTLLLLPTLYFMLFMAGAKLRHLLGIIAVATVLVALPLPQKLTSDMGERHKDARRLIAYTSFGRPGAEYVVVPAIVRGMRDHQVRRIAGWLRQGDPAVAQDAGFQLRLSKLVMGSGGLTGQKLDNETARHFVRILPEHHTDFIFSVIAGQWGFLGCVLVLGGYAVILVFGAEIAAVTHDAFGRLLAVGVIGLLLSQLFVNLAVTMGLLPVTGMTLPFLSYGGSSLVVSCAAIGLLVNVGQRRPILLSRRPFEHGEKRERVPQPFGPLAEGRKPRPRPEATVTQSKRPTEAKEEDSSRTRSSRQSR